MKKILILTLCVVFFASCQKKEKPRPPQLQQTSVNSVASVHVSDFRQLSIRLNERALTVEEANEKLFEVQGEEEARLRFTQMDLLRRVATGRLSELFYKKEALQKDLQVWSSGLPRAIERSWKKISQNFPVETCYLEAYARGVNKYLRGLDKNDATLKRYRGVLTRDPKFDLTTEDNLWKPQDSIAIFSGLTFILSSTLEKKIQISLFHLLWKSHPKNFFAETKDFANWFDLRKMTPTTILDPSAPVLHASLNQSFPKQALISQPQQKKRALDRKKSQEMIAALSGANRSYFPLYFPIVPEKETSSDLPEVLGSNNWVVSPKHTDGDYSFLANDPHLTMSSPNIFQETALNSIPAGGDIYVRGMSVVGVPSVLLGHNKHLAWGFTNHPADVDDLYYETIWQKDGKEFVAFADKKVEIEHIQRTFPLRQSDGTVSHKDFVLRWVPHHGPIFSDFLKTGELANNTFAQALHASYRWTGHQGTTELVAIFRSNQAKTHQELRESLSLINVGIQNIIYADRNGDIGYVSEGLYPIRNYLGVNKQLPYLINNMTTESQEWSGFRQVIPQVHNPKRGYQVTANNHVMPHQREQLKPEDFSDYYAYRYSPGFRAKRIEQMIEEKIAGNQKMSFQDMVDFQMDQKDLLAAELIDGYVASLDLTQSSAEAQDFAKKLLNWDKRMNHESYEALQYVMLLGQLNRLFFAEDKFVNTLREANNELNNEIISRFMNGFYASHLMMNHIKHRMDQVKREKLFSEAIEAATIQYADLRMENDTWGKLHQVKFFNLLDGIVTGAPFNSIAMGGSWNTVNVGGFSIKKLLTLSDPKQNGTRRDKYLSGLSGPTFGMVYQVPVGDGPIIAKRRMPGGNFTQLYSQSRGYQDLIDWRQGNYTDLVEFIH